MSELRFSQAIRVLALFAAEGASTAMFLQGSYGGNWLPRFVSHNELDPVGKRILIASIVAGALVGCIPAVVLLLRARRRGELDSSLEHLNRIGRLLAFTLVLWAVPPML